ncbi:B12-binding domain-containing protein [Candidatus Bathyarchaeota archaeon]|nr:cobalamin B12-binding domain-containing protein [Candidatus Bathyarchaeota archaeon]MBL7168174.1 B12-binding domain-containing protein [Candidatus Bathyarchaeota archaeon]
MTKEEEILQNLSDAVQSFDSDAAIDAAKASVEAKISPVKAIEEGLAKGLRVVGDKFEAGELWLPHLVLGAEALEAAVKVLEGHMAIEDLESTNRGTIVIGTVEGDIHDLGLRIVASMLRANGFRVYDIGCDARTLNFIEKAKEVKADIIAASSLMTTTMPFMKDLVEALETAGIRDQYKVMVGGGPVTEEWAKAIGVDGYGKDAAEAVRVAKELVKK